ncbi:MAG: GxxExxY protein [Candidatus Jettenia caeni]|nr:MAG: GxxExxY protein [Candidatus Jettenia caeni]
MKIFYKVYNKPGYSFPEKVYEDAMMLEFKRENIPAIPQYAISVLISENLCPN